MEHKGPGKLVARPPALAPLVVELSPGPISAEVVTIHRGPGRKVARGVPVSLPRPLGADTYDDEPPCAA